MVVSGWGTLGMVREGSTSVQLDTVSVSSMAEAVGVPVAREVARDDLSSDDPIIPPNQISDAGVPSLA
jgi:hypothetical protein